VRNVICTKWGAKYGPDYANRLYRMVRRNLSGEYRFVCFTDDPTGLDEGIEAFELPNVPVVGHRNDHGWKKLGVLASPLADLSGSVLYLDLDVVITGDLAPFFEIDGAFRVIKDYKPFRYRHRYTGNTSVFRFQAGAHSALLDEMMGIGERVFEDFRNEQELISWYMHREGLIQYWPRAWCPSYKHDCVPLLPMGWFKKPSLPAGAKVVVFHGDPKPEDAITGGYGSKWYRLIRPAPWLADYMK
jgi:hypothetical protein